MLPVIESLAPTPIVLIENSLLAFCTGEEVSVTCTVKLYCAAVVGVPLIVPALLKAKPAGNAPDATVQEYGAVPPAADSVELYALPTEPLGKDAVVMASAAPAALVVIENNLLAFCTGEEVSVTCTVKLDCAAVVGVPLIVPALLKAKPAGNAPDATVQEYGVVPPAADSVAE
jgi:translation initiation factor 2 alpha subunit (eIF-2alpha)